MQAADKTDRLSREAWLDKALDVLASQGPGKITIQHLCDALKVSRGSFYWHFADRAEFLGALLDRWHELYTAGVPGYMELSGGTGREKFQRLVTAVLAENLTRFDPAIRGWALQEPAVAEKLQRTELFRLAYIEELFAEMGFRGKDKAQRARIALAALTMQSHLLADEGLASPKQQAALMVRMFCDRR